MKERFETAAPVPAIREKRCLVPMQDNIMLARDSYTAGHAVVDLNPVPKETPQIRYRTF